MASDNKPAAAQERVAWASTGATGHKVVAMPGLHKLPYGDYDLFAAPVAAAPRSPVGVEGLREVLAQLRREMAEDKCWDYTEYEKGRIAEKERCISLIATLAQQPAAPGIDLGVRGATLTIDGRTFTVDEVRAALIDASPKGGSDVVNGIQEQSCDPCSGCLDTECNGECMENL